MISPSSVSAVISRQSGNRVALDDERMIARRGKRIRHALEQIFSVVLNRRSLAVHHAVIHHDFRAERVPDALMAEADAEHRNLRCERADDFVGQAGFARRTRAGRNQDALRLQRADLAPR